MHWLLAIVGLVIGAIVAEGKPHGFFFGFGLGWLIGKQLGLRRDLEFLLKRIQTLESQPVREAVPQPARVAEKPVEKPVERAPEPAPAPPPIPEVERPAPAVSSTRAVFEVGKEPTAADKAAESEAPAPIESTGTAPPIPPRTPLPPRPTMEPPEPPAFVQWFTTGNVPVKIGMGVLFFGVAALLKYAADQGWFTFPIELRLAGVAAAAIGGLVFAWRQRFERRAFALAAQGGALGILMLVVFAAYRLYHLLPAPMAFALLLVIVAGAAALAVLQDAVSLAVLGFLGGYLAPVLISTGSNNHVALFSYYAVLNAAVFGIAWRRPWRALNLLGFAFTFGMGLAWGGQFYKPELFWSVEPFLILFFFFYLGIAVLYALRQPPGDRGLVDGTLVFGLPLLAFPLQAALLKDDDMALAFSALAVAVIYGVLSATVIKREGLRVLGESFAGLAIGFATLAVPIALNARWTSCTWALEGAALVWLGLRQSRQLPVFSGVLLQLLASAAYFVALVKGGGDGDTAVLNGRFLAGVLLSSAMLFSSLRFDRAGDWPGFAVLTFLGGWFWWAMTGASEIDRFVSAANEEGAMLMFVAGSFALAAFLRAPLVWSRLSWPLVAGLALGPVAAFATWDHGPLRDLAALGWPVYLALGFASLWRVRDEPPPLVSIAHVAWLYTLAIVAGFQLRHMTLVSLGDTSAWTAVATFVPLIAMFWFSAVREEIFATPLAETFASYRMLWRAPAAIVLSVAWFLSLWHDGECAPLSFVPVLNPLELAQLGVLILFATLARREADANLKSTMNPLLLIAAFAWVSVATLRGVHHLADLPWNASLLDKNIAQASLSVVWSLISVGAMISGHRRGSRAVWTTGAIVMGIVVVKLILVDRHFLGEVQGFGSVIVVGLLFAAVGYFAPTPPREGPVAEART